MFKFTVYDASEKCPKCHSLDHKLAWFEPYEFFGHSIPEHIRVECGMCQHRWYRKPINHEVVKEYKV